MALDFSCISRACNPERRAETSPSSPTSDHRQKPSPPLWGGRGDGTERAARIG